MQHYNTSLEAQEDYELGVRLGKRKAAPAIMRKEFENAVNKSRATSSRTLSPFLRGWFAGFYSGVVNKTTDHRFLARLERKGLRLSKTEGVDCPKCNGSGTLSNSWTPALTGKTITYTHSCWDCGGAGKYTTYELEQ